MTHFLLSFGWNWLLVPVAIWFCNGLRKVVFKPRLAHLQHTKVGDRSYLLTVRRQQLLPPWRELTETWHVVTCASARDFPSTREGDGATVTHAGGLHGRLRGCLRVALLRDAETEELSK